MRERLLPAWQNEHAALDDSGSCRALSQISVPPQPFHQSRLKRCSCPRTRARSLRRCSPTRPSSPWSTRAPTGSLSPEDVRRASEDAPGRAAPPQGAARAPERARHLGAPDVSGRPRARPRRPRRRPRPRRPRRRAKAPRQEGGARRPTAAPAKKAAPRQEGRAGEEGRRTPRRRPRPPRPRS